MIRRSSGGTYETSAPSISGTGGGCCRTPDLVAHRSRTELSIAAGALYRGDSSRRIAGHRRAADCPTALGAPGQQFVVENRAGAASNIATEAVAHAPPDGYTLYLANTANAINATLYDRLNFNFMSDIAPVASIARTPGVMEVNPSFPAKTVPEFIAYAKANPGKVNMASAGTGNVTHMWGELFKLMAGVDLQHVPYRGEAPAITDLLGGQVDVLFGGLPAAVEHVRAGRLRALAVTTATRSQALPNTPTIGDFLTGYEASAWYGVAAPKKHAYRDYRQAQQGDQSIAR
jgi:tripartite-type tricarboxylate transporter receptor subunit TctC